MRFESIAQGGLRITWPLERTVFQRDVNGGTDVWFAGEFGYQTFSHQMVCTLQPLVKQLLLMSLSKHSTVFMV